MKEKELHITECRIRSMLIEFKPDIKQSAKIIWLSHICIYIRRLHQAVAAF